MKRVRYENINTMEYWDREWARRPFELDERFRVVARLLRQAGAKRVLDIGAGDGTGYGQMRTVTDLVYFGSDFSHAAVEKARADYPEGRWLEAAYDVQPFDDRHFDAVISQETIEHVDSPLLLLSEMKRLAKDTVIVTTPNGDAMLDVAEHLWTFDRDDFREAFPVDEWNLGFSNALDNLIIAVAFRKSPC